MFCDQFTYDKWKDEMFGELKLKYSGDFPEQKGEKVSRTNPLLLLPEFQATPSVLVPDLRRFEKILHPAKEHTGVKWYIDQAKCRLRYRGKKSEKNQGNKSKSKRRQSSSSAVSSSAVSLSRSPMPSSSSASSSSAVSSSHVPRSPVLFFLDASKALKALTDHGLIEISVAAVHQYTFEIIGLFHGVSWSCDSARLENDLCAFLQCYEGGDQRKTCFLLNDAMRVLKGLTGFRTVQELETKLVSANTIPLRTTVTLKSHLCWVHRALNCRGSLHPYCTFNSVLKMVRIFSDTRRCFEEKMNMGASNLLQKKMTLKAAGVWCMKAFTFVHTEDKKVQGIFSESLDKSAGLILLVLALLERQDGTSDVQTTLSAIPEDMKELLSAFGEVRRHPDFRQRNVNPLVWLVENFLLHIKDSMESVWKQMLVDVPNYRVICYTYNDVKVLSGPEFYDCTTEFEAEYAVPILLEHHPHSRQPDQWFTRCYKKGNIPLSRSCPNDDGNTTAQVVLDALFHVPCVRERFKTACKCKTWGEANTLTKLVHKTLLSIMKTGSMRSNEMFHLESFFQYPRHATADNIIQVFHKYFRLNEVLCRPEPNSREEVSKDAVWLSPPPESTSGSQLNGKTLRDCKTIAGNQFMLVSVLVTLNDQVHAFVRRECNVWYHFDGSDSACVVTSDTSFPVFNIQHMFYMRATPPPPQVPPARSPVLRTAGAPKYNHACSVCGRSGMTAGVQAMLETPKAADSTAAVAAGAAESNCAYSVCDHCVETVVVCLGVPALLGYLQDNLFFVL